MQDEVKVTQAARDAAADHTTGFGHIDGYTFSTPHMVRTGHCDNHPLVQAFAKFEQSIRHQAERDTLARIEPVAWMYSRPNDPFPPSIMAMRHDPEVFATMAKGGWTETPIYALPPAPEAGQ